MKTFRILIAKPGLDGHDRGAKVIVRALRDAGFEVIYTGIRQTPEMIAQTAVQEDVDAVGLSLLSGAHMTLFPRIVDLLREKGMTEVPVFGGGLIPDEDVPVLRSKGVEEIFGPGTPMAAIVDYLRKRLGSGTPAGGAGAPSGGAAAGG
ncbi:MAG: cobalamin B12-binding domain-containing protein [Elusimicrobia bacterium]|nr:cobalamin B12-binding domain-containing protein [Elusimicrobiota bacterium]